MSHTMQWNAGHYDEKMNFVSQYGKGLIDWLAPVAGERILDLGCGTGDLTAQLAETGAVVTGSDFSPEMIATARSKYPHLSFEVADAHTYRTDQPYDAIFSNAALHWMKGPEEVAKSVWLALAPGGRFVAEFGGKGNCEQVIQALRFALGKIGISADDRHPWYFPSVGEYTSLLERQGFRVVLASHFDRPTVMPDNDRGLRHWLDSFCSPFFAGLTENEIDEACRAATEWLRPTLYSGGQWIIDYKRIRVIARKESATGDQGAAS
ncbi:methyltransferase domain-containing protein [Brevibacillus brevis]|uniref:Methyltransferase domain-containing protein n=1 Tax=Brevibacillus brevis TaxID=1393 RepID=A0ABY9T3B8_BREBE|nr:methyltransferase domain-containing protein [Brevibacillus brevis]WNC12898.1 methyltransferase domain-containing protein [Brevibacillus brevis]